MQTNDVFFSETFDLALVGMAIFTLSGHWIKANPTLLTMLGEAPNATFGPVFSDILHPDCRAVFLRACRALRQGKAARFNLKLTYCGRHGRTISALTQIVLINRSSAPYFFVQISSGVTCSSALSHGELLATGNRARKRAKHTAMLERLRAGEQKFRTLAENSPNVILRYDHYFRRIYVNPAYLRETGYPLERVLGRVTEHTWHADISLEQYRKQLAMVLASGTSHQMQIDWIRPGTQTASSFVLQMVAELAADDQITGVLVLGVNISELKQAEQRLRELASRQDADREEERRSIAREIHDELGQYLTALRIKASSLRLQFDRELPMLGERINEFIELIDASLRVVRHIASSLRPAALDMGIVAALEWLIAEFRENSGIDCRLQLSQLVGTLDNERATAIFRVVQESLTNVARHAQATRVAIDLALGPTQCQVAISDNGQGFDTDIVHNNHFGLMGMRERALALGGHIEIDSGARCGSTIRVLIPIPFVDSEL